MSAMTPLDLAEAKRRTWWLSDHFFDRLVELGLRHFTDPEHFLAVWSLESGLNPRAINKASGARGLNQMMPATLRGLGAPADFDLLAAEEQLPWIERLITSAEKLNGGPFDSAARYYHSNFYPATMRRGNAPETIVVSASAADGSERAAYAANKALDADHDGKITLADLAALLAHAAQSDRYRAAVARLRASAALHGIDHGPVPAPPPPFHVEEIGAAAAEVPSGAVLVVAGAALGGVVLLLLRRGGRA